MKPERDFTAMSPDTIAAGKTDDWIAVLPLGAHEQHGPHLPFETDTIIAQGISSHLSSALDQDFPVTFLPAERVGYSVEHLDFEGSESLPYDAAVARWINIGTDLAALGIRKLLLLNAHGGNSPLMTIVATELRVRCAMLCVATSWTRFISADPPINEWEKAYGIHGGDIETSMMLLLAPEKVDLEQMSNFSSFQEEMVQKARYLRAYGPHAFGWKMQDLNPIGVTGDASAATRQKGDVLMQRAVQGLKELLQDMHAFDLNHFEG